MASAKFAVEGLKEFNRALKAYAPEVFKEFRKQVRELVGLIAQDAKNRASWSTGKSGHGAIPTAIAPVVESRALGVRVSRKRARHGPLYERGSKGQGPGVVRHPVFGNRSIWRTSRKEPFLAPAVEAKRDEVERRMVDVVEEAARKVGMQ